MAGMYRYIDLSLVFFHSRSAMDRNPVGFDANDKQWTNLNQKSAPESLTQMSYKQITYHILLALYIKDSLKQYLSNVCSNCLLSKQQHQKNKAYKGE